MCRRVTKDKPGIVIWNYVREAINIRLKSLDSIKLLKRSQEPFKIFKHGSNIIIASF